MKFEFAATILISLLASSAFGSSQPLTGTYKLLSNDCIVGGSPAAAVDPSKIKLDANDVSLSLLQTVSTQFAQIGEGDEVLAQQVVGDFSSVMLGGSTYRTIGVYSNGGRVFAYSEYDSEVANGPLSQLRSTTYELSGRNLKITQTGDLIAPRVCLGVLLN